MRVIYSGVIESFLPGKESDVKLFFVVQCAARGATSYFISMLLSSRCEFQKNIQRSYEKESSQNLEADAVHEVKVQESNEYDVDDVPRFN